MKKLVSIYSIIIGLAVIIMWTILLINGNISEGKIVIGFHLYSEFAMAVILIVSGFLMLRNQYFALETNVGGHAMLIYSALNAAGFSGQKGEIPIMVFYIFIFILSVGAICGIYYQHIKVIKKTNDILL